MPFHVITLFFRFLIDEFHFFEGLACAKAFPSCCAIRLGFPPTLAQEPFLCFTTCPSSFSMMTALLLLYQITYYKHHST